MSLFDVSLTKLCDAELINVPLTMTVFDVTKSHGTFLCHQSHLDGVVIILRDNVVIYEGELESLRRFKDDAKEVQSGTECGIGVKNYNDVKIGDQIECYERIEIARTIG